MIESGTTLCDMVRSVALDDNADMLIESFDKYNHFIVAMSNQYDRLSIARSRQRKIPVCDPKTGEVLDV